MEIGHGLPVYGFTQGVVVKGRGGRLALFFYASSLARN
jgi:hypothetical protein